MRGQRPIDRCSGEGLTNHDSITPYRIDESAVRKADWEGYVSFGRSRYSVPPAVAGKSVVVGRRDVLAALWNPSVSHFERYQDNQPALSDEMRQRCEQEALRLCEALGYDMNTVEFAIRDGVPYAIDFMNSAPDFDISSLGDRYFGWVVDKMANYTIQVALEPPPARELNWSTFIGNPS